MALFEYSKSNGTIIANILDNNTLFEQLQRATPRIPSPFLPQDCYGCLVVSYPATPEGGCLEHVVAKINFFARAHIRDPGQARWLLAHTWFPNNLRPQSTLVCFMQHRAPHALVDNTEGVGVANQIVTLLEGLRDEGLVTTNVNYELIQKMHRRFGVLFGGSFAELAKSLHTHSIEESAKKSEKVATEKGLLMPITPSTTPTLGNAHAVHELTEE